MGSPERALLRAVRLTPTYPPTFIVGVPRSGTTLTALLLARSYRWAYIPDLANRHPEFTLTLSAFARARYGAYRGSLVNEYGRAVGRNAPTDGWELFHRWFPRYNLGDEPRENRLGELRTLVRCLELIYCAPFMVKNNNSATRIQPLRRTFPDAMWVHVTRDELDTAVSLIGARRHFGVGLNEWWSAAPPAYWNREFSDEFDQVAHQVVGVEGAITAGLASVDPRRVVTVSYAEICATPGNFLARVATAYERSGVILEPFATAPRAVTPSEGSVGSSADRLRLADALARLRSESE